MKWHQMAGSTGIGVIRILCLGHDNDSVGDSLSTAWCIHKEHFFWGARPVLALRLCHLPKHIPCKLDSLHISHRQMYFGK